MRTFKAMLATGAALGLLAGCNTVEGMKKDLLGATTPAAPKTESVTPPATQNTTATERRRNRVENDDGAEGRGFGGLDTGGGGGPSGWNG